MFKLLRCEICGWTKCENGCEEQKRDEKTMNFIRKARERHGLTFDYSKITCIVGEKEVIIIDRDKNKIKVNCRDHLNKRLLCGNRFCDNCFPRSFASYEGVTKKGKRKVECVVSEEKNYMKKLPPSSHKKCKFRCDVCNHTFSSSISNITGGNKWCPYCVSKRLCEDMNCNFCFNNSLASYEGLTLGGKKKIDCFLSIKGENQKLPRMIFSGTAKKGTFKCDMCNHTFHTKIVSVTKGGHWCPYCVGQKICGDCSSCFEKSFASYEGLTLRGKKKVDCFIEYKYKNKVKYNSKFIFKCAGGKGLFRCDVCNHLFNSTLRDVTKDDPVWCSYCSGNNLCGKEDCNFCFNNSLASCDKLTPGGKYILNCFLYVRNNNNRVEDNPIKIFKQANKKGTFQCDICHHKFCSVINNITGENSQWCPYCSNTILCEDEDCNFCFNNSFASYEGLTPNGKKKVDCFLYLKDKEGNKEHNLRNIFKGTHDKGSFNCDVCKHKFNTRINGITGRDIWCPYCACKKFCEDEDCNFCFNNSFASYEGLTPNGKKKVDCFLYYVHNDTKKNNPRRIFKRVAGKGTFKCDVCDYIFNTTISNITGKQESWCLHCSKPCRKLCGNKNCNFCFNNSFASYEGLTPNGKKKVDCFLYLKEEKEPNPINFFISTIKKGVFECDICYWKFNTSISCINRGTWCPHCKKKTELKLKNWLKKTYPQYQPKSQAKFLWCKNPETNKYLPFDFHIKKLKLIIELDGPQHFEQVANWKSPEETTERDNYKTECALEKGFTVLRILQEDVLMDRNNWEINLKQAIKKYDEPTQICIGCETKYKNHI